MSSQPLADPSGDDDSVWIRTVPDFATGIFRVEISYGQDQAVILGPDEAITYAQGVLFARVSAMHDAAVIRQLHRKLGIGLRETAMAVSDLRKDRPPLDHEMTKPIRLEPGVAQRDLSPFLAIFLGGKQLGQWDMKQAAEHALMVLQAVMAADLDSAYYRYLTGTVGLERDRVLNVVADLATFMEDDL